MAITNDLLLQLARKQLQHFADDPILEDHREAEECLNCEAFLQRGIDAYRWLSYAEEALILADREGIYAWRPEIEVAIKQLYADWLKPCEIAQRWIATIEKRGYQLDNLSEFRQCCEAIRGWIESNEWYEGSQVCTAERYALESD